LGMGGLRKAQEKNREYTKLQTAMGHCFLSTLRLRRANKPTGLIGLKNLLFLFP
jgi:hypothetical protein